MATDVELKRKALLPVWIKVFGWIFIIMGSTIPFVFIFTAVTGQGGHYEIFGISYDGSVFNPKAIMICIIICLMAITAFGLIFGKKWGLDVCLANGYLGLLTCIGVMALSGVENIRLEPLLQIPYIIKLHKIRNAWKLQE